MRKVWFMAALTLVLAVWMHYRFYLRHDAFRASFSQMLYLPSGKYLKPASFGYHSLLADFVYLWSIQYYTNPQFRFRLEYLKHTYDLIAELDPRYIDAYKTGAFLLFVDAKNPEAGLKLLDEGFQRNPDEWILPTDAGFYCMMTLKDKKRAAAYFERASMVPDAPSMLKRVHASLRFKMGEKVVAYRLWQEVYETDDRPTVRETAEQHLHDLKVLIDLEYLDKAIALFRKSQSKYPLNLKQLVAVGVIPGIPLDPEDNEYLYDSRSGKVKYSKSLTLYRAYQ